MMIRSLRMAAMARFGKGSDDQHSITDVAQQKLVVQYLQQEIYGADDANLVDEEDMHIFGLRPMTDPLELVSCNACKKPIKTSHYAVHAELCKTLNLSEEVALELTNGKVKKKPPRKERKKALPICSTQEVLRAPLAADSALVQRQSEEQTGTSLAEVKQNGNLVMDDALKTRPNTDCSAGAVTRPAKRGKMINVGDLQVEEHQLDIENGVTKSYNGTTQKTILHKGRYKQKRSTAESEKIPNNVSTYGKPDRERKPRKTGKDKKIRSTAGNKKISNDVSNYGKSEQECGTGKTDVPVPIATKVYYSQRNNRLRSSLSQLYHGSSSTDHCTELVTRDVMHRNLAPVSSSAPHASYHELISGHQDRTREQSSNTLLQSDQILAQCPELFLSEAGESPPVTHNPQFLLVDNGLKPQYQIERARSSYNSGFASNSG
ncbi:hypothetical protein Leryth_010474 [Lithospermum erythrorhizon]|nr:hypothetical protein Leryth_010474 [Lithospermum erythrorhizon]